MNRKMVFNIIGRIILTEAVLFLLPIMIAAYYGEFLPLRAFLISPVIAAVVGVGLILLTKTDDKSI